MTDSQNVDLWGDRIWEAEVENKRSKGAYCLVMVKGKDTKGASQKLRCSGATVRLWAREYRMVCDTFGRDLYLPIPANVYKVAAKAKDPVHALKMAVDVEYRQEQSNGYDDGEDTWSARQLSDYLGLVNDEKVSRVVFKGKGSVDEWDVSAGRVTVTGLPLSGKKPEQVQATIREVLQGGNGKGIAR